MVAIGVWLYSSSGSDGGDGELGSVGVLPGGNCEYAATDATAVCLTTPDFGCEDCYESCLDTCYDCTDSKEDCEAAFKECWHNDCKVNICTAAEKEGPVGPDNPIAEIFCGDSTAVDFDDNFDCCYDKVLQTCEKIDGQYTCVNKEEATEDDLPVGEEATDEDLEEEFELDDGGNPIPNN